MGRTLALGSSPVKVIKLESRIELTDDGPSDDGAIIACYIPMLSAASVVERDRSPSYCSLVVLLVRFPERVTCRVNNRSRNHSVFS